MQHCSFESVVADAALLRPVPVGVCLRVHFAAKSTCLSEICRPVLRTVGLGVPCRCDHVGRQCRHFHRRIRECPASEIRFVCPYILISRRRNPFLCRFHLCRPGRLTIGFSIVLQYMRPNPRPIQKKLPRSEDTLFFSDTTRKFFEKTF